jgi:hypothetical protein
MFSFFDMLYKNKNNVGKLKIIDAIFWLDNIVQGRTGHKSNATLVAGAFTISNTKCQKRGLLETFWGAS